MDVLLYRVQIGVVHVPKHIKGLHTASFNLETVPIPVI